MIRYTVIFFTCLSTLIAAGRVSAVPGNELPVSSPFFRPYEENFFLALRTYYTVQSTRLTIPTFDSVSETRSKEISTGATLTYGVTEHFSIGVLGKYMINQDYRVTRSGVAFTGNPGEASRNAGFYDAGFQAVLRLLGTRTEEWFFDIEAGFLPGLKDRNNFRFTLPHNQYIAVITIGKNTEVFSYGIVSVIHYYSPSALDTENEKNNQVLNNSQFLVQIDFGSMYLRVSAGAIKFLDRRSNENAVKKQFFPAGQFEIGFPFDETCALNMNLTYVSGAKGELNIAGLTAPLVAQPVWIGSAAVLFTF